MSCCLWWQKRSQFEIFVGIYSTILGQPRDELYWKKKKKKKGWYSVLWFVKMRTYASCLTRDINLLISLVWQSISCLYNYYHIYEINPDLGLVAYLNIMLPPIIQVKLYLSQNIRIKEKETLGLSKTYQPIILEILVVKLNSNDIAF